MVPWLLADTIYSNSAGPPDPKLTVFVGQLLIALHARVLDEERVLFLVKAACGLLLRELVQLVELQLHAKIIISNGFLQALDEEWAVRLARSHVFVVYAHFKSIVIISLMEAVIEDISNRAIIALEANVANFGRSGVTAD